MSTAVDRRRPSPARDRIEPATRIVLQDTDRCDIDVACKHWPPHPVCPDILSILYTHGFDLSVPDVPGRPFKLRISIAQEEVPDGDTG